MLSLAPRADRRVRGLLWFFYFVILVRNAWLCEDAFITYRVVDNWTRGYGLRWNTVERVQVYTHPLWTLLLGAVQFVARDYYFSAMSLSLVCSGASIRENSQSPGAVMANLSTSTSPASCPRASTASM